MLRTALKSYSRGNIDDALDILELTPDKQKTNTYYELLVRINLVKGDIDNATKYISLTQDYYDGKLECIMGILCRTDNKIEEAIKWFKLSSEKDNKTGNNYNELGRIYADLYDDDEAIKYYEKSVKCNNKYGLYSYAFRYGNILGKDKVIEYYKLSIEQNFVPAMYNLGIIYLRGRKKEEGLELIKKSVGKGYSQAIMKLGHLYYEGTIIGKNIHEAFKLYTKFIRKGFRINDTRKMKCYEEIQEQYQRYGINEEYIKEIYDVHIGHENENKIKLEIDKRLNEIRKWMNIKGIDIIISKYYL